MLSNISRGNRYKELCQICNMMAWGSPQGTNMGARHRFFYQLPPIVLICGPISQRFRKGSVRVTKSVKVQDLTQRSVWECNHALTSYLCLETNMMKVEWFQNRVSVAIRKGLFAYFIFFVKVCLHRAFNISARIISFNPVLWQTGCSNHSKR